MSTNVLITHVEPAWILTTAPFVFCFVFGSIPLHLTSLCFQTFILYFNLLVCLFMLCFVAPTGLARSHPSCLYMWMHACSATSARDNRGHVSVSLFSPPSHVPLCQISGHPQRIGQPGLRRWRHGSEVRQAHQTHWCTLKGLRCMSEILYRGIKTQCQSIFEHPGQLNQWGSVSGFLTNDRPGNAF